MGFLDFLKRDKKGVTPLIAEPTPMPPSGPARQHSTAPVPPPRGQERRARVGTTLFDIEAVGESYRREAVSRLFRSWGLPEGGVKICEAVLEPEPRNPHDPNAVKVVIDGLHVAYVPSDETASVKRAIARAGRGIVAFCPARVWATPEDGLWRARVTLTFQGTDERERDFAAERRDAEAYEAEKQRKEAEREAIRQRKEAARAAGLIEGDYWMNYREAIAELKRQGRLDEARALLERCVDAAESEGAAIGEPPNPWPTEQLSVVLGKLKDRTSDLAVLERYERLCGGAALPDKIAQRLNKARIAG